MAQKILVTHKIINFPCGEYFLARSILLTFFSRNRAKLDHHRSITQLMSNEFAHVSKFNHMVDNVCFIFTSASFNFIIGRLSKLTNQGWHNSVDRVMKFYSHYEIRIKPLNHPILKYVSHQGQH